VAAQVAYSYLPERRRPAATRAIVLLLLATSSAETVAARGRRRAGALLGSAAAVGFGAELVGVATGRPFGHYSYGPGLGPQVRGVPLLAAAAWTMMSRPAWVVAGLVDRRPLRRVPLAAGALAAWDVFLDPRMVREGYWTWPAGGWYEGVPAQNFLGWVVTGLVVFSLWAALDRDDAAGGDGALALYVWTWLGESYASAAVWHRPRVATAGGLAMGAFALPALQRRLSSAAGSRT
jgi:putative membrane protein